VKFLLIEDDQKTATYIETALREHGHAVDLASDGDRGLILCTTGSYDLAIIDRRLPGIDGLSIVKAVRAANIQIPIMFLTTVAGVDDRVEGLDAGGDDYIVKPFHFSELLARANALLRRPPITGEPTILRVGDLEMDLVQRRVTRGGCVIDLMPKEFDLLGYLVRNTDHIVTRKMLLEHVWGFHFNPRTSIVETHMSRLRAKVDKPFDRPLIHTVPRAGYSLHA